MKREQSKHDRRMTREDDSTIVTDPVCGMTVDPATASSYDYQGQTFFFCSSHCQEQFRANPAHYLARTSDHSVTKISASDQPSNGEITARHYTCPMHPEIERAAPGSCPVCGMALELRTATAEEAINPELLDMTRRFWLSLAFTVPVFVLAMSEMIPGRAVSQVLSARGLIWLQFVLATPVVLWGGRPFFQRGWESIRSRHLNMFTLIAIGTGTAYCYSLVAALFPTMFPDSFRTSSGEIAVYFEAAAVITTLVLLGQVLELHARSRTSSAIRALLRLAPKTARVLREGEREEDVPLEHVIPGDRLRVRPGEKVPVDGVVLKAPAP